MKKAVFVPVWIFSFGAIAVVGAPDEAPTGSASRNFDPEPRILILDPVNLENDSIDAELGWELRNTFRQMPYWKVISFEEFTRQLQETNGSENISCMNFNCAREVGDVVNSDYTIFMTFAMVENLYVFAMNCINSQLSQVVWTHVGEVEAYKSDSTRNLFSNHLNQVVQGLSPNVFDTRPAPQAESYGVIDGSKNLLHGKVMAERVMFHTYSLKSPKTVDRAEVQYTLEALGMKGRELNPTEKNIVPVGENLGVNHLIYSSLDTLDQSFKLTLSLFDIGEKKRIRTWSHNSKDFRKILRWEEVFFLNLTKRILTPSDEQITKTSFAWKKILTPVVVVATGIGAFLIINEYK